MFEGFVFHLSGILGVGKTITADALFMTMPPGVCSLGKQEPLCGYAYLRAAKL